MLDIDPKSDLFFFFNSFSVDGLENFFIQDDKKVIEKILFGTEKLTRADNKITLVNIKFNLNTCKNLSKKELDNLSVIFLFYPIILNKNLSNAIYG